MSPPAISQVPVPVEAEIPSEESLPKLKVISPGRKELIKPNPAPEEFPVATGNTIFLSTLVPSVGLIAGLSPETPDMATPFIRKPLLEVAL